MNTRVKRNNKLCSLRKDKKLTQIEAAQKLNIPINVYAKMEQGLTSGKIENWCKIQEFYKIPDELMWSFVKESRRY